MIFRYFWELIDYKEKDEYTDQDLLVFIKENEEQLKREYIDFNSNARVRSESLSNSKVLLGREGPQ